MTTTFELGPKQKLWIAALRSGEFKQGKGFLKIEDHYCCLGVACQVLGLEFDAPDDSGVSECDSARYGAPESVIKGLALSDDIGRRVNETNEEDSLTELNDNGASFEEIADIIEADPSAYFTGAA